MSEWSLKKAIKNGNWKPNQNDVLRERYNHFKMIALNRFNWDLKDNPVIEPIDIENLFYNNDFIGVWVSEDLGYPIVTPVKMDMKVNFLNKPIVKEPILHGDMVKYRGEKITWCYGDDVLLTIVLYCQKLMDIQTAKDQQIFNQRSPVVAISGDKSKVSKDRIAIETIKEDIKIMLIEEGMIDNVKALKLDSMFNVPELNNAQQHYENLILNHLGIDTDNPKRERKIVDEQESNDEVLGCIMHD